MAGKGSFRKRKKSVKKSYAFFGDPFPKTIVKEKKLRKRKGAGYNPPLLKVNSARGRKVRANARVTMPLKALRRLVSAAKRGASTTVKAVMR